MSTLLKFRECNMIVYLEDNIPKKKYQSSLRIHFDMLSRNDSTSKYLWNDNDFSLLFRPTSDSFTSQVTLDIGSTFTDEMEVRNVIEQQLHLHSLGNVQVRPEEFSFRVFQGKLKLFE